MNEPVNRPHLWQFWGALIAALIGAVALLTNSGKITDLFPWGKAESKDIASAPTSTAGTSDTREKAQAGRKFAVKIRGWAQDPLEFTITNFAVAGQSAIATLKVRNTSQTNLKVGFDCTKNYLPRAPGYKVGTAMTRSMNAKLTDSSGTSMQLMDVEGVALCEYDILIQRFRYSPVTDLMNLMSGLSPDSELTVTLRFSPLTRDGPIDVKSQPGLKMNFLLQASFWYSEDKASSFGPPVRLTASFEDIQPGE